MQGFNSTGAITANPNAINPISLGQSLNPNPISTALNKAQSPNFTSISGQNTYVPPPTNPTPTTPVSKMKVTNPSGTIVETTHDTTSPGSYKGFPIMGGDQASIQSQMATIDAKGGTTAGLMPLAGQNTSNTSQPNQNTAPNDQFGQPNPTDVYNKNAGFQTQGMDTASATAPAGISTTPTSSAPTDVTSKPAPTGTTFPGLLNSLTAAGSKTQSEQRMIAEQIAQIRNKFQTDSGLILNQPTELNFQTGRINALQNQEQAQEATLQGQLQSEIAAGTQNIGALTSAAGLAQPSLAGFNQQPFNPITGQFGSGGGTGTTALSQLPQQAQTAIQSYAKQIKNGSMTRADAESRLSAYGVAGTNALNESLGTGFNTNASNASAGTTAVGQQLTAAIPPANQALDALQTAYKALPGIEASGFSGLNGFLQNLSMQTGIGRTAVSNFQGALQEARSRIDAALTGVIGVDAAGKQANALLPDNMTPEEMPGKIAAAKQYLQNQLKSYTESGNQTQNANTSTGSSGVQYNTDGTLKAVSF